MELRGNDNYQADLTQESVEKFLYEFSGGKMGKGLSIALPLIPAVFQVPPEVSAAFGITGAVYEGLTYYIGIRHLKRFIIEWFRREIGAVLDKQDEKQLETVRLALVSALRCKKEEQIVNIVAILKGVCEKQISPLDGEDLIYVASEMSENEATLLREVYQFFQRMERYPEECFLRDYGEKEFAFIDRETRSFLMRRLSAKGLLNLETGAIFGNDGKTFFPTEAGRKLFRAIESVT